MMPAMLVKATEGMRQTPPLKAGKHGQSASNRLLKFCFLQSDVKKESLEILHQNDTDLLGVDANALTVTPGEPVWQNVYHCRSACVVVGDSGFGIFEYDCMASFNCEVLAIFTKCAERSLACKTFA